MTPDTVIYAPPEEVYDKVFVDSTKMSFRLRPKYASLLKQSYLTVIDKEGQSAADLKDAMNEDTVFSVYVYVQNSQGVSDGILLDLLFGSYVLAP